LNSFEFVDGRQNLTNLIRLGFAFRLLYVDARVAWPRSFEHCMTCSALAGLAEMLHVHSKQVSESDIRGRAAHCFEELLRSCHAFAMVSLLAPFFRIDLPLKLAVNTKGAGL